MAIIFDWALPEWISIKGHPQRAHAQMAATTRKARSRRKVFTVCGLLIDATLFRRQTDRTVTDPEYWSLTDTWAEANFQRWADEIILPEGVMVMPLLDWEREENGKPQWEDGDHSLDDRYLMMMNAVRSRLGRLCVYDPYIPPVTSPHHERRMAVHESEERRDFWSVMAPSVRVFSPPFARQIRQSDGLPIETDAQVLERILIARDLCSEWQPEARFAPILYPEIVRNEIGVQLAGYEDADRLMYDLDAEDIDVAIWDEGG